MGIMGIILIILLIAGIYFLWNLSKIQNLSSVLSELNAEILKEKSYITDNISEFRNLNDYDIKRKISLRIYSHLIAQEYDVGKHKGIIEIQNKFNRLVEDAFEIVKNKLSSESELSKKLSTEERFANIFNTTDN